MKNIIVCIVKDEYYYLFDLDNNLISNNVLNLELSNGEKFLYNISKSKKLPDIEGHKWLIQKEIVELEFDDKTLIRHFNFNILNGEYPF